ncbi:MAG: hypothetical protein H6983_02910 [Ectothiorhodospiraceae bacterium]|nr:hypothetical protein [Ectothiorhodospiraceae bacterium]
MVGFLKRLFSGGSGEPPPPREEASMEYEGFTIVAAPQQDAGGWRVAGAVRKEIDGEVREHTFVRADVSPDKDAVVQMTLAKGQRIVDEQGERIFAAR